VALFLSITGGSTIEAMADAVEQATVVLIFYSEHYKASHNCRSGMASLV